MVRRCAFYLENGRIIRRDCSINWNRGFSRSAKLVYIQQISDRLIKYGQVLDVTTASPSEQGKSLSPYCTYISGMSTEDYWHGFKKTLKDYIPGAYDYIYLGSLSEEQREFVLTQNGFSDVFHKPESGSNAQARSLCVFKLLHQQGKCYLLNDATQFIRWYLENCRNVIILTVD